MNGGAQGHAGGVYLVDKPAGITSFDVVRRLKKLISSGRLGHTGTLDPLATGVLAVCVGEATKLIPYMRLEPKKYQGNLQLGVPRASAARPWHGVRDHQPSTAVCRSRPLVCLRH